jgi:hypothetical protein
MHLPHFNGRQRPTWRLWLGFSLLLMASASLSAQVLARQKFKLTGDPAWPALPYAYVSGMVVGTNGLIYLLLNHSDQLTIGGVTEGVLGESRIQIAAFNPDLTPRWTYQIPGAPGWYDIQYRLSQLFVLPNGQLVAVGNSTRSGLNNTTYTPALRRWSQQGGLISQALGSASFDSSLGGIETAWLSESGASLYLQTRRNQGKGIPDLPSAWLEVDFGLNVLRQFAGPHQMPINTNRPPNLVGHPAGLSLAMPDGSTLWGVSTHDGALKLGWKEFAKTDDLAVHLIRLKPDVLHAPPRLDLIRAGKMATITYPMGLDISLQAAKSLGDPWRPWVGVLSTNDQWMLEGRLETSDTSQFFRFRVGE